MEEISTLVDLLNLATGVITGAIAGINIYLFSSRRPQRRLWRLTNPSALTFCISTSASTDTGKYIRHSTGVGQVRGLAILGHSLKDAYPNVNLTNVSLSVEVDQRQLQNDLILLGGSKNNDKVARVFDLLNPIMGVHSRVDGTIEFDGEVYQGEEKDGVVKTDYALFIAHQNPFAPRKRLIMLCGVHTYGVAAAARLGIEQLAYRWFLPRRFAALAKVVVESNSEVTISLVKFKALKGRTRNGAPRKVS